MTSEKMRALVVDDEPALRNLTTMSLRKQGFTCDSAADGVEAERLISEQAYDVVVTDLRMPRKHGHALATTLLELERPPLIIVLTGVAEPRLAKDLLVRGVDDVVFKPIDFNFLGMKIKVMADRRASQTSRCRCCQSSHEMEGEEPEEKPADAPVSLTHLERKLNGTSKLLPISKAAIDVYNMTTGANWEVAEIVAAMQQDAALVAEVLRLANSSLHCAADARITDLENAIVRMGQKRVGELALATNALSSLTPQLVPWLDVELTWKRSMAAGLALDKLVATGQHQQLQQGLFLSAIMHPVGRILLGTLFPRQYDQIIQRCRHQGATLQEQEKRIFPLRHTEVMAHVLAGWNVPQDVFLPLKFSQDDYASLARLGEPERSKAELLKLAIFVGRLAAEKWENWDLVQFPPLAVLHRLRIPNLLEIVDRTQSDLQKLSDTRPKNQEPQEDEAATGADRTIAYCNATGEKTDMLLHFMTPMGLTPVVQTVDEIFQRDEPAIVNCIGASPTRLPRVQRRNPNLVVVSDAHRSEVYARYGNIISVPNGYGRLKGLFLKAAEAEHGELVGAESEP